MKKEIITKDIRKQGKVDAGVALETLVGNVLGMVVWHAEGEQDGHPVGSAVGDSDGTQLRADTYSKERFLFDHSTYHVNYVDVSMYVFCQRVFLQLQ
jgi:hypothetical protein